MSDHLKPLIREYGLSKHENFLLQVARPSVELIPSRKAVKNCCSKLGGMPDLPSDFDWPSHSLGPYRFFAQFNLQELASVTNLFPSTGLLSFFYAHDNDNETWWSDPDYVRVFHFPDVEILKTIQPPKIVNFGATLTVRLEAGFDLPREPFDAKALATWPIDEDDSQVYCDLRASLHPRGKYLLGYPFNTTLAYDPTPGPSWVSLFTTKSSDDLEWWWHDGNGL